MTNEQKGPSDNDIDDGEYTALGTKNTISPNPIGVPDEESPMDPLGSSIPMGSESRTDLFHFEFEMDRSSSIAVVNGTAVIRARFKHFHLGPITLEPGIDGSLNLGIRLYRNDGKRQVFEDRMIVDGGEIQPNTWTSAYVRVPKEHLDFDSTFVFVADFLVESHYWFASKGMAEFRAEVRFSDGIVESFLARDSTLPIRSEQFQTHDSREESVALSAKIAYHLVFDVSDLVQYFQNARLPTGIQRVQIEVITSYIFSTPEDCSIKIGCFTKHSDTWIEVPPLFFNHICKLAVVSGDRLSPEWLRVLEELRMHLQQAKLLVFARGAYLINLGTSWWLQNYFLHVRVAKARFGIRYVPYVHDCIPIMTPEHCVEGLTRDFITWALGAFQHADHIIVNSKATAKDVKFVAKKLGHAIEEPIVVSLDADYRAANARLPPEMGAAANSEIFQKNEIQAGHYVLFVSTIESRKNHLMAFSAWLSLAKRHGIKNIPKLVCVGNHGWLNDAIFSKLSASKILRQKVAMLSGISDPDLELLYRNCLFTLYPSSYEGWGLPVTESLCFGKVPVLANGSSLPEAGGEFGEYFDLGSESALLKILERLIFDTDYRSSREQLIARRFRPRSWAEISENILSTVRDWARMAGDPMCGDKARFADRGLWPFPAELGRYYGLIENEYTHIWRGMVAGEMYRQGDGCWWTEPWGCWTKPKGARLAFLATISNETPAIVYLGIRGVQGQRCVATIGLEGMGRRTVKLNADQAQWLVFRVSKESMRGLLRSDEGVLFEFLFSSDKHADFRETTNGADHRVASIGVCGFMVCAAADMDARLRFVESVALSDMHGLIVVGEQEVFEDIKDVDVTT